MLVCAFWLVHVCARACGGPGVGVSRLLDPSPVNQTQSSPIWLVPLASGEMACLLLLKLEIQGSCYDYQL